MSPRVSSCTRSPCGSVYNTSRGALDSRTASWSSVYISLRMCVRVCVCVRTYIYMYKYISLYRIFVAVVVVVVVVRGGALRWRSRVESARQEIEDKVGSVVIARRALCIRHALDLRTQCIIVTRGINRQLAQEGHAKREKEKQHPHFPGYFLLGPKQEIQKRLTGIQTRCIPYETTRSVKRKKKEGVEYNRIDAI